jgi:phosphoribosyl 1,2-cyclic phosphodiesterase
MVISFCSFSSGSSGNCYLVKTESTALLIDVGISASETMKGIHRSNTDPDKVSGILVTHEHSDHIRGLAVVSKRLPAAGIYGTFGTLDKLTLGIDDKRLTTINSSQEFRIGDIDVRTFPLSHDTVDPIGYTLSHEGKTVSIVTDTGIVTPEILEAIADADLLALESNHDPKMLMTGRYPAFLKQRIAGIQGHLSNAQAADAVLDIMNLDRKPRCVLLAHLSRDNNDPKLAEKTVSAIVGEMGYFSGRDLYIQSLRRNATSPVFEI